MKRLILIAVILLLSASISFAQPPDFCEGDLDYDGDCDANDVSLFLEDFGRELYYRPCPPDGPSPVPQTGQTTTYATGDDGDLERGVALVAPRFTDNGDGTVTDNQTGLIWLKNANCFGSRIWNDALSDCNGLANGQCGLIDGSNAGDWRLPQIKELQSLVDFKNIHPSLPSGHPFINVLFNYYWSSTTYALTTLHIWCVVMTDGDQAYAYPHNPYQVWCVRGGR